MKATVLRPFRGVADGQVYPRKWKPGDELVGDLARVAVLEGNAKAVTETLENRAIENAPENKAAPAAGRFLDGSSAGAVAVGDGRRRRKRAEPDAG